jgi:uncharacterized membrane protein YuzA (DUF378 family)
MKIDKFTKIVLVIIAINLTLLSVKNLDIIPKTYAKESFAKNEINYGLVPLNENGTIDVNIKSVNTTEILDVNIKEVGGSSIFSNIPVEIKNQSIEVKSGYKPIKVEIENRTLDVEITRQPVKVKMD